MKQATPNDSASNTSSDLSDEQANTVEPLITSKQSNNPDSNKLSLLQQRRSTQEQRPSKLHQLLNIDSSNDNPRVL